ncbi:hypothetical protein [Terasakiella sp. SH-1]|nr:hypothetical protein [Terasakiella sp. SH-1]
MSDKKPHITSEKQDEKKAKEARLAEALRANLRRRKAQTKARKTDDKA